MINFPYTNDNLIDEATQILASHGIDVLQIHRLAMSEADHVGRLLELFDLPPGARIVDLGCGVGAVIRRG